MRPSRSNVLKLSAKLLISQNIVGWKDLVDLTDNADEVYIIENALDSLLKDNYIIGKETKNGVVVTGITGSGNKYIESFL